MWMLLEWNHTGKPTSLGLASGIVAGLVAITPAAGHVKPLAAILIGAVASVVCYAAVRIKVRVGLDDSLDAFGVHGVGGIWGALATGLFCFQPVAGLLGGNAEQLLKQLVGVAVTLVFAGGGTWLLATLMDGLRGLRVSEAHERDGLDISAHGERGYHL
jgi:Amt family ammonium transporter